MDPRITPARPDLAASALKDKVKALRYAEGRTAIITKGSTALRGSRNSRGKQMTELLFGERFTVYENRVGWIWGQSQRDGYVAMPPPRLSISICRLSQRRPAISSSACLPIFTVRPI
ncbi:hypothetical protein JCM17846_02560 [Iodidimonas nitroreducens]|uniref:Bacterial dipeptidyl-peptidase SH3 domain-containing protein n=1 Tax=Iodidimonas nitroreducens TaxID=1236968 RepID=A0A5A7N491_9PROT|nr:hypothetical protein [Iodidimonas nitroreducens]GER02574.1 hypothetical protein JCM17846_02560 [Iodidimonas nitroreducens]